jgi:hypothetical protein
MRDTELRANTYKQGRAALTRLHKDKHYLDWLAVGNALAEARQEAKEACGLADTNMPDNRLGKAFAQAMSEILHREKMDSDIIDTATRGQLSFIIEHLPDIEAWRKNELSPIERAKLNHPSSIYRHYRKYAGLDGGKKREKPAEKPTLLEETVALRGQVDALEQRIAEVEEERDVARGTVEQLRREATAAFPAPPPTPAKSDDGSELFCSFCDKSRREVVTMISATRGFICSECVELCNTMLRERKAEEAEAEPETKKAAEYGTWRRARSKEEGYEHKCYFGDKHVATVWKADGGGWEWFLESNTGIGDVVETIADAKALAVEAALKVL